MKIVTTILFLIFYGSAHSALQPDSIVATDSVQSNRTLPVQFPSTFKDRYTDSDFIYERVKADTTAWERFTKWLAETLHWLFGQRDPAATDKLIDLILKGIAILVIGIAIYLIAKVLLNKEGRWIFGRDNQRNLLSLDDIEKNLLLVDFEKLIAENEQNGDTRLVIRYYYLWLLRKLTERGHIEWDPEKTNTDFLEEISTATIKSDFAKLSHAYNYVWYGAFDIDRITYEKMKSTFQKTLNTL